MLCVNIDRGALVIVSAYRAVLESIVTATYTQEADRLQLPWLNQNHDDIDHFFTLILSRHEGFRC